MTTIKIDAEETWRRLNARKRHGDTFNDVILRLLDATAENDCGDASTSTTTTGGGE